MTISYPCSVIVTYHPNLEVLTQLLDALQGAKLGAVVVDNGSPQALADLMTQRGVATEAFIPLQANFGIAAAQNRGIAFARQGGADAVVLFDQDSLPSGDMIARLLATWNELAAEGIQVAAVGPLPQDRRSADGRVGALIGDRPTPVDHLISSGSLIAIATLDAVGPMREELFIDYVDIEWCLRASTLGYRCYQVPSLIMAHQFGTQVRAFGREFTTHPPMRHYYLFRNSLWLWRQHWIPLGWRLSRAPKIILRLAFNAIFARPHRAQWRMMRRGIADGLAGRMGKRHE